MKRKEFLILVLIISIILCHYKCKCTAIESDQYCIGNICLPYDIQNNSINKSNLTKLLKVDFIDLKILYVNDLESTFTSSFEIGNS